MRIYNLAVEGYPAKKICSFIRRDKAQVSRILKAFEKLGFLVCINPGDKVKFYEATKKKLTEEDYDILSTILKEKSCKNLYGGYYTRCHGLSYKANIKSFKNNIKWDDTWHTRGSRHDILYYPVKNLGTVSFIRITSKYSDILRINLPSTLWNVRRGNPSNYLLNIAKQVARWFSYNFSVSLSNLEACKGESLGIALRDPALVKIAQEKTIYFENGTMIDASHGVAEFEGPNNIMSELFSLPERVAKLEQEMLILTKAVTNLIPQVEKLSPEIQRLSKQMDDLMKLFSQPKSKDERIDVT